MTMNNNEIELSLDDTFFAKVPVAQKAESDSMPSVLVDEQLLAEIATIPDRFGFKIGDVADLLGIKQYILRYWEQEFEVLKPKKASNNQRLYTKKDVENAFLIKKLLYRDRFSIEGARQAMRDVKFALKKEKNYSNAIQKMDEKNTDMIHQVQSFVRDIQKIKQLFI
jgi:DNA-binding transcriptional MerR regulator